MNQLGLVEIAKEKNERLYRALLPMGVPWTEVHEVLLEMVAEVAEVIKANEEHERLEKEKEKEKEGSTPEELPVLEAELAS